MTGKFKKFVSLFTDGKTHREMFNLAFRGYLYDTGWINSFRTGRPVDVNSKPVPWLTLPFNAFIGPRLKPDMNVFEFGSGNSTLYYASKVKNVIAVENDRSWFDLIHTQMPANATILFEEVERNGKYARAASAQSTSFNMVIVDGRDRVNCMRESVNSLTPDGVMVLDNSDREEYREGIDFLIQKGFKKIDFWGIAPSYGHQTCTTVFYRTDNCLDI